MDLRQITYFLWICEHGSVSAAARRAGVAQPALSQQIRRLEEELGVVLFDRTPTGAVPTAQGRSFYALCAPVRDILAQAREAMRDAASPSAIAGPLRCGFPPSFFKRFLGRVVADFAAAHPAVELTVREGYGGTLRDWVLSGELDFAFGGWSPDDSALAGDLVFEEELVLVCGAPVLGERLAPADLSRAEGLKLILPTERQMLGPILRQHIAQGLIRPARTMVVDSYLGVMEVARASDWVGFVPVTGMLDEVARRELHVWPLDQPRLRFRWHLIHERGRPLGTGARVLAEMVAAEIARARAAWEELLRAG